MKAKPRLVWSHSADFGVDDSKGRRLGAKFWIFAGRPDTTQVVGGGDPLARLTDGFEVGSHVTRAGVSFGAVNKWTCVLTIEAAQAEVRRRLAGMTKRYAKKHAMRAAGIHATWVDRETKARVAVYDADDDDADRYDVVCEDHSTVVNVKTIRDARTCSTLDFCDDCRAMGI